MALWPFTATSGKRASPWFSGRRVVLRRSWALALAAVALGAAFSLIACSDRRSSATRQPKDLAHARVARIEGSLSYRDRVALEPGGAAIVTLSDVSAPGVSRIVARQTIALVGQRPPFPFQLAFDPKEIKRDGDYVVSGEIRDAAGVREWATDGAPMVNPARSEIDLGVLTLVRLVPIDQAGMGGVVTAGFACGDSNVSVQFVGDQAQLTFDDTSYELFEAPAATGVRYASVDGSTWLVEEGDGAELQVRGRALPGCRKRDS
jgi:putative lipoprotein